MDYILTKSDLRRIGYHLDDGADHPCDHINCNDCAFLDDLEDCILDYYEKSIKSEVWESILTFFCHEINELDIFWFRIDGKLWSRHNFSVDIIHNDQRLPITITLSEDENYAE